MFSFLTTLCMCTFHNYYRSDLRITYSFGKSSGIVLSGTVSVEIIDIDVVTYESFDLQGLAKWSFLIQFMQSAFLAVQRFRRYLQEMIVVDKKLINISRYFKK